MKIVTSRDIKNNPNILFDNPSETIITSRGRPRAICIPLDADELDDINDFLRSIHHARAKRSVEKIRDLLLRTSESLMHNTAKAQEMVTQVISNHQGRLF